MTFRMWGLKPTVFEERQQRKAEQKRQAAEAAQSAASNARPSTFDDSTSPIAHIQL